jgi:hypothetical protein
VREIDEVKEEALGLMREIVKAKPSTFVKRAAELREKLKQVKLYRATFGDAPQFTEIAAYVDKVSAVLERCGKACMLARQQARSDNKK